MAVIVQIERVGTKRLALLQLGEIRSEAAPSLCRSAAGSPVAFPAVRPLRPGACVWSLHTKHTPGTKSLPVQDLVGQ